MSVCEALHNIITNNNFCFLCFKNIEENNLVNVEDEVNVELVKCTENITLYSMLLRVIGYEIVDFTNTFTTLCIDCTKLIINSYTFIQNSLEKLKHLKNAISRLTDVIAYTKVEDNCKSLYVELNLKDFATKIYYDSSDPPKTAKEALKQYHLLDNLQVKPKLEDDNKLKKRKTKYIKYSIKLRDMLDETDKHRYKCKICGKLHSDMINLKYHFIRLHATKSYKCDICNHAYGSEAILEAHKSESHYKAICSQCGKSFNNKYTLKQHELGHHFTIVCTDCGRCYKSRNTFKKHKEYNVCDQKVRANPSDAKYTCDYCNKKYTQKVSLRVHIQYEHGNYKAHVCEWCDKKFWAKSRLKAHIVKHTKERKFSCEMCGGKFVTKESLLYHTRRHTGERPYECPHCDSKFLSASRKVEHIKRAHKNFKFECNICNSKFGSMFYLQKHIKRHSSHDSSSFQINVNDVRNFLCITE